MYLVKLEPKAIKDLQSISKPEARKIAERMKNLEQGLVGDIKRLTNFTPEYRHYFVKKVYEIRLNNQIYK